MMDNLICKIFGHWKNSSHEFREVVTCDRCKKKIRAEYDFHSVWYSRSNIHDKV